MTVRSMTPKGAATRDRIVDAAAGLFHERGVEATGLDDVLVASGTGKSQLYHYFEGKSELVGAVIDLQVDRILGSHAGLLAAVAAPDDLYGWADEVVATVAARHGAHGCPLGSLAAELADRGEPHRRRMAAGFARWEDLLADAIGRAGGASPDAAAVLLTALQGGLLLADATHEVRHLRLALTAAIDAAVGTAGRRGDARRR